MIRMSVEFWAPETALRFGTSAQAYIITFEIRRHNCLCFGWGDPRILTVVLVELESQQKPATSSATIHFLSHITDI